MNIRHPDYSLLIKGLFTRLFLVLWILSGVLVPVISAGQDRQSAQSVPDRNGDNGSVLLSEDQISFESRQGMQDRVRIPLFDINNLTTGQGEGRHFHGDFGQHHDHQDETIIHVTDYLYQAPEIRNAYEAYRQMRERPGALKVMETPVTYNVGETRFFHVVNFEESRNGSLVYEHIEFELKVIGEMSEIWVETDELGSDKIDEDVISAMMEALEERTPPRSVNPDQGIILNNIDIFAGGDLSNLELPPHSRDNIMVLVADIQDGWDPDNGGFVAGYFNPGDLVPRSVNSHSNEGAIIYINSRPGIYTEGRPADPSRPLSVIAHELQHLIHSAGKAELITFMDEGQSELAEVLNGFDARTMTFLDDPDEVSGNVEINPDNGFLRWRRNEPLEVLMDYQRAQLFHGYLYERVGLELIGSLTQSESGNPWTQYQRILNQTGKSLEFTEVLAEFYVMNWLNRREHDPYSYSLPQFASVGVLNPGRVYDSEVRPWVKGEGVRLRYGGAKYTQWRDVQDIWIEVDSPQEILHYVISESEDGIVDVQKIDGSDIMLPGTYRSVVLVSVNTVVASTTSYGRRNFEYTADWTPDNLRIVEYAYSSSLTNIVSPIPVLGLPFETEAGVRFKGTAVRVNPEYEGTFHGIDFLLWTSEDAVSGSGTLRVSITESRLAAETGVDAVYVPENILGYKDVDFDDLNPGLNSVDVSGLNINLDADNNYHVFLMVVDASEDAELLFVFDNGSNNRSDTDYYPIRTLVYGIWDEDDAGWTYLLGDVDNPNDNDNKNLVLASRILSRVPVEEDYPAIAKSDSFELLKVYPNPFNANTNIELNIPVEVEETVPVRVDIYDVMGRRVTTIMEGNLQAGSYTFPFEPRNIASGVYIARMQAGGSVDTRKLMYLK